MCVRAYFHWFRPQLVQLSHKPLIIDHRHCDSHPSMMIIQWYNNMEGHHSTTWVYSLYPLYDNVHSPPDQLRRKVTPASKSHKVKGASVVVRLRVTPDSKRGIPPKVSPPTYPTPVWTRFFLCHEVRCECIKLVLLSSDNCLSSEIEACECATTKS